jgi:hypothetical protein
MIKSRLTYEKHVEFLKYIKNGYKELFEKPDSEEHLQSLGLCQRLKY